MGYTLETATQINGVWVQTNEIQKHLARYAQRLVCDTGMDDFQFQHFGTATGICVKNRLISIATAHQYALGEEGKVGIVCDPGEIVALPHRMLKIEPPDGEVLDENIDWVALEFDPKNYRSPHLQSQFLKVENSVGIQKRVGTFSLNIGFPTRLQNIDYCQNEVALTLSSNVVELIESGGSSGIHRFKTLDEDRFFEDGMSGSPVFEVYRDTAEFKVRWLGIVVLGGPRSRFGSVICARHIIDSLQAQML